MARKHRQVHSCVNWAAHYIQRVPIYLVLQARALRGRAGESMFMQAVSQDGEFGAESLAVGQLQRNILRPLARMYVKTMHPFFLVRIHQLQNYSHRRYCLGRRSLLRSLKFFNKICRSRTFTAAMADSK